MHSHIPLTEKCAAREAAVLYDYIRSCQKRIIYPLVCHTWHGSLLYTLVMRLLMHGPMYCPWACIHLVQCFRYVCATAIVLLSLQSASAVMMLHHYCQKTQSSSLETWQKKGPKPPVLQPFLQKTLLSLDWALFSSFAVYYERTERGCVPADEV